MSAQGKQFHIKGAGITYINPARGQRADAAGDYAPLCIMHRSDIVLIFGTVGQTALRARE